MCIYGSNATGGNTEKLRSDFDTKNDNFMTLAHDVELTWEGKTVHKTGTSFATPIAAAFAANMLALAQCNHDQNQVQYFRTADGMKQVFRKFSRKLKQNKGKVYFLEPWSVRAGKVFDLKSIKERLSAILKESYYTD